MPHPCQPLRLLVGTVLAALTLAACSARTDRTSHDTAASPPGIRHEAHLAADGILPAGNTPQNPQANDPEAARAGASLFKSMNCDGCHGEEASGWVGPNLGDGRWRYGGSDAEVFNSIYYGRPKGMPAFGGALGARGVWVLVTYLKSLPRPPDVPTESWETQ